MGDSRTRDPRPLDVVMRILARRAHGRAELTVKMRQRGFPSEEISAAIDRAIELGLMETEDAVAERFATELAQKPGATPRGVRQKLSARGFPGESIRRAISTAFAEWDALEAALVYANRDHDVARTARRLERKGFPADVIIRTVRHLQRQPGCRESDPEET